MAIQKIVVRCLPSNLNQPVPPAVELSPDQAGLIPGIGDRFLGNGFSMDVTRRKFEVMGEVMHVYLEDRP